MTQASEANAPAAIASLLNEGRGRIAEAWSQALATLQRVPAAQAEPALEQLSDLLGQLSELAQRVGRGEPLEHIFELARRAPAIELGGRSLSRLAQLSALRSAVLTTCQGLRARDLCALNVAFDAILAAALSRHEDESVAHLAQLSAERERARDKLESLLAASPVGIGFVDRELRYLRINDALAALNGRSADDHIGHSVSEVLPDFAPVLEPMLREVLERREPVLNRELTRPSPGDPRVLQTLLATFFPVRSAADEIVGVGAVVSDISDVRHAQASLRQQQERLQSILEHTPAPIWIKDADGRIVLANHQLAEVLGHRYEEVMGCRSEDILPAELAAQHRAHDLVVMNEQRAIEVEETVPGPDGIRTFLSNKFPLPGDPPLVGAIATEITERKRMEQELRVAVQARERVLAVVSHDLRSPLNTIQVASATLLRELEGDPRRRRPVEMILRACLRMEHLIADLLDMASIAAGHLSVQLAPEAASDLLREACELHAPLAQEKGIHLGRHNEVDGTLVLCDRQRIVQVFTNLIGNSLKFCRAGDTVTLGCEQVGEAVRFYVEDTGPGIESELLDRLFDPYWSGGRARGGIGLGLFISRGIVERHGGRIGVQSTLGERTRFWFDIPLAGRHAPEP